jgi:hypothetical protein
MSSQSQNQTLADYVALALSPALIMGLVASLVFFLINVLYVGEFVERLRWILFFFVFGAVLLARMTMLDDTSSRVGLYGVPLGILTWIGMQMFVEYPAGGVRELSFVINALLIGLVWWCAHRLTWDCTNIDEEANMNAQGLLQAAGLEGEPSPTAAEATDADGGSKTAGSSSWLERWQRYRAQREKNRTLGVWVVYFSLAALPLFGLGQALIPTDDVVRRRSSFWLILVYAGCGLGLLLTTCFLSLRRYLRQRRLQMPAAMTGVWLTSGGLLIAALLLFAALLPRPEAEYSLFSFATAKAPKRDASQYALKGGQPGKGEGRPGGDNPKDQNSPDAGGDNGQQKGERGAATKQGEKGSGGQNGKSSQNGDQQGQSQGGESNDPNLSKGDPGSGRDRPANKGDGERPRGDSDKSSDSSQKETSSRSRSGSSSKLSPSALRDIVGRVAPVLKWIVFALIALAVLFFVLRSGLQFWANFSDWARRLLEAWRNFWANLFGGRRRTADEEKSSSEAEKPVERPFASFRNPFVEGRRGMAVPELIRYTFAAAQAWARERDLGRHPGETPLEFAARVGAEVPALEKEMLGLALLYARAVYASGGLPSESVDVLRGFWDRLEAVAEQPLSA